MFELKSLFEQLDLDFKKVRKEMERGTFHREFNRDVLSWSNLFQKVRRFLEDALRAMLPFRVTPLYNDPDVLIFQSILEEVLSIKEVRITGMRTIRSAIYDEDRFYPLFLEIIQGLDDMISGAKPIPEPDFTEALRQWVESSEETVFEG